MIYESVRDDDPLSQGDVFFGIPAVEFDVERYFLLDDEGSHTENEWAAFPTQGAELTTSVALRSVVAIVGSQDCDAARGPEITFFEVSPFVEVEGRAKDVTSPDKWQGLITQHARVNQKWFYLPPDPNFGLPNKSGVDFRLPIRVPLAIVTKLLTRRRGRLKKVAQDHFRERVAEFFRRYAYNEWYPLTDPELAQYAKNRSGVTPYSWQRLGPRPGGDESTARSATG